MKHKIEELGKAAKKEREFKAQTAKMKKEQRESDTSWWKDSAQKAFNKFIRLRDAELGCASCNKPSSWRGQWHASHFKSVGARPDLRFNEDNCHKACSVCNNYLSGNVGEFRKRIIEKIGIDRLLVLESDDGPCRLSIDDLKNIRAKYLAATKILENI